MLNLRCLSDQRLLFSNKISIGSCTPVKEAYIQKTLLSLGSEFRNLAGNFELNRDSHSSFS